MSGFWCHTCDCQVGVRYSVEDEQQPVCVQCGGEFVEQVEREEGGGDAEQPEWAPFYDEAEIENVCVWGVSLCLSLMCVGFLDGGVRRGCVCLSL
mgnify:CR=1 FL=1